MGIRERRSLLAAGLIGGLTWGALPPNPAVATVILDFDYTYDTGFFKNNPQRQAALQAAVAGLSSLLNDNLSAITPGGGNTWTATFTNPTTNAATSIVGPQIAAQHILIYVGARAIGGSTIADSEFGKASAVGTAAWVNTVLNRGQAANTDFGPWGGEISFDTGRNWNFDPSTDVAANQFDFAGAALHEVLHILGYGDTPSWTRYVDASGFNGPITDAFHDEINKGAVPLSSDESHWAAGTEVTVGSGSVPLMISDLAAGRRYDLTGLDIAGLCDIGWDLRNGDTNLCRQLPEPPGNGLVLIPVLLLGILVWTRRQRRAQVDPSATKTS